MKQITKASRIWISKTQKKSLPLFKPFNVLSLFIHRFLRLKPLKIIFISDQIFFPFSVNRFNIEIARSPQKQLAQIQIILYLNPKSLSTSYELLRRLFYVIDVQARLCDRFFQWWTILSTLIVLKLWFSTSSTAENNFSFNFPLSPRTLALAPWKRPVFLHQRQAKKSACLS